MTENKFITPVVTTTRVYKAMKDKSFADFVNKSLTRHFGCDWGEMGREDKAANDDAFKKCDGRLFSAYLNGATKIWIITEWDRSATTVLFPDEY